MALKQIAKSIFVLSLFVALCLPTVAAEEPPQELRVASLSDLGERSSQLTDFVEKADDRLMLLSDVAEIISQLQEWESKTQEMRQQIATLGNLQDWYVDRLIHYNDKFGIARKAIREVQNELVSRQQEVDKIRLRQKEERTFWKAWVEELKTQGVKVSETTVKEITYQLTKLDAHLTKSSELLPPLQERASAEERIIIEEQDHFSQALSLLRKATFRKNSYSFFNREFYAQFGPHLWEELRAGVRAATAVDVEKLKHDGWAYLLFFLVLVALAKAIQIHRDRLSGAEEWQFVLNHSWAAGSFVAAVTFSIFFPAPSAIVKFCLMAIGVASATVLATALIQNKRQTQALTLAAILLLTTTALRLVALPQPLFRIYIALLALAAIPLLIQQIQLAKETRKEKGDSFFTRVLRTGIIVLALSLGGQVVGYVNFSSWLIQAAFETGMVMLFAHMGLRLGNGGIDFLLDRLHVTSRGWKKYQQEGAERLKFFLKILVSFYALLNLLPVWRVFGSLGDAWDSLAEFSISVGDVQITPQMAGFAIATLYLAMQVSWLLQAMCETQIFYRKSVDRGVRDAIKKLVHYGVVLLGFLVTLSILGMSLQHFVIILGAFGVGIGFGLQDIVNNFLSGIILLFERPVKIGDGILVDGEYGTVKHIGLRSTIVETLDHSELIVPNSQMISQKVTNWTLSNRRVRIVIPVGVAYGSPVPQVMSILVEVPTTHPEVLEDPEPSPIFTAFGSSSLDFELRVWIANVDMRPRVKSELLQQIEARFREEGIQIPFPQRDLHLRSIDSGVVENLKI